MFIILKAFCSLENIFFKLKLIFVHPKLNPADFRAITYNRDRSQINNLDKMKDRELNCNFSYTINILNLMSKPHLQV